MDVGLGVVGERGKLPAQLHLLISRGDIPLCPNLFGSELAPTTANRGDVKNVFKVASIVAKCEMKIFRVR